MPYLESMCRSKDIFPNIFKFKKNEINILVLGDGAERQMLNFCTNLQKFAATNCKQNVTLLKKCCSNVSECLCTDSLERSSEFEYKHLGPQTWSTHVSNIDDEAVRGFSFPDNIRIKVKAVRGGKVAEFLKKTMKTTDIVLNLDPTENPVAKNQRKILVQVRILRILSGKQLNSFCAYCY